MDFRVKFRNQLLGGKGVQDSPVAMRVSPQGATFQERAQPSGQLEFLHICDFVSERGSPSLLGQQLWEQRGEQDFQNFVNAKLRAASCNLNI